MVTKTPSRPLRRLIVFLALLLAGLALFLRLNYAPGQPYRDLTTASLVPESALEEVVSSPEPIGNVAVSRTGRVFYTLHPESRPPGPRLFEWAAGKAVPFPSPALQEQLFNTPLGLTVDGQDRLWVIDHHQHATGPPRVLAFDLASGALAFDHSFRRDCAPIGAFFQDLAVDATAGRLYIADASFWGRRPAIVIYDLASDVCQRVLERDASVRAQDWLIRTPTKEMVFFAGLGSLKVGVDGIALSPNRSWLYYAAMNHDSLFRMPTAAIAKLPSSASPAPERVGPKPLSDGIACDAQGRVLITDVDHGAVLRSGAGGELETLIRSPRIRWADNLAIGQDGWVYLADSAIPDHLLRTRGHIRSRAPYFVFRFPQPGGNAPASPEMLTLAPSRPFPTESP